MRALPPTSGLLGLAEQAVADHGAMQKPTELAALLAILESNDPRSIWEIGTATGGTLWALASVVGDWATIVSIDLPGGPHGGAQSVPDDDLRDLIRSTGAKDIQIVRGDSQHVDLDGLMSRPPEFLLIDGDHSQMGVRSDWKRYAPLVWVGGIVALHDILPHPPVSGVEVEPVWQDIVATEPHTVEIIDRRPAAHGGQWGGIGVVFR